MLLVLLLYVRSGRRRVAARRGRARGARRRPRRAREPGGCRDRFVTWLSSGQVAAAAGINPQTLRYYQRRGLLAEPDRSLGGHRLRAWCRRDHVGVQIMTRN